MIAPRKVNDTREARQSGDCFVVVNSRGECWDGERWVGRWGDAVQFRRPDPAYELCEELAREAELLTGVAGSVCYILPGTPSTFGLVPFRDLSQVDLRRFAVASDAYQVVAGDS